MHSGRDRSRRHGVPARAEISAHWGQGWREGRNRFISGFEGEKEKCKFDLVDKKWDDIASREGDLCGRVLQGQTEKTLSRAGR